MSQKIKKVTGRWLVSVLNSRSLRDNGMDTQFVCEDLHDLLDKIVTYSKFHILVYREIIPISKPRWELVQEFHFFDFDTRIKQYSDLI